MSKKRQTDFESNRLDLFEFHKWSDPLMPFILHSDVIQNYKFGKSNWHNSLELIWILDGEGELFCNSKQFDVKKDDIYVINSGEVHRITSKSAIKYNYLIVGSSFLSENGFDYPSQKFKTKINDGELRSIFQSIVTEYNSENPFKTPAVRSSVLSLLVYLCRNHLDREEKSRSLGHSPSIKKGLEYVNSNFTRQILLDDIAKAAGVSKYHFSREFKRYTGHTVVTYLNILRSEYAKKLLQNTDFSVSDVAGECGYETLSYFTESFKKYTGTLPSHYRSKNKNK